MAIIKVTLLKGWEHPAGVKMKAGETIKVLPTLRDELLEGGYIAAPKKQAKKNIKK